MFNQVILDAVRVAERESRSALPNAPVVETGTGERRLRFGARLTASAALRRLADAIEPAPRLLPESSFTPDPYGNC